MGDVKQAAVFEKSIFFQFYGGGISNFVGGDLSEKFFIEGIPPLWETLSCSPIFGASKMG